MIKIGVIGAGKGGLAILDMLSQNDDVEIVGICDVSINAPGIKRARELSISICKDYQELINNDEIEVIINVTGNQSLHREIAEEKRPEVELVGGLSALLMWDLVEERRARENEALKSLNEQQALYRIGILLSSAEKTEEVLNRIVESAIEMINVKAGSLALYDEETGEMYLAVSIGFSKEFSKVSRWKLRNGGLTKHIIDKGSPVIISDVDKEPAFDNPIMLDEGIKSLVATPLIAEGRIVGILYVDDFVPRQFTSREISFLNLLAAQATFAIEKIQLLERTEKLAITDELTRLYNHRFFIRSLDDETKRAKRYTRNLSLIMFDIDHFKNYNDTNGHLKGNKLLENIARILINETREVDIVARYGGEEFGVILPETGEEEAYQIAERIRDRVEQAFFDNEKSQPLGKVTISAGVATYPQHAQTKTDIIHQADKALYAAKDKGRNKVIMFS